MLKIEKIVAQDKNIESMINEVSTHWDLQLCEGMLKLQEIFIDHVYVFLVLDYQQEGSLLSKILSKTQFNEKQTKMIMTQLLLAIDFLHKRQVVHRDLKLDNVLINKISDGEYDVKIADFGLATKLPEDGGLLYEMCGTPSYFSPEMLRKEGYREKSDIFSIGSILFNLITGRYLFNGKNNQEIIAKNKACDIS